MLILLTFGENYYFFIHYILTLFTIPIGLSSDSVKYVF